MLRSVRQRFSLAQRVKDTISLPFRHLKEWSVPKGERRGIGHSLTKFEEEAAEWQAFVIQNAFEANIHQNYETVATQNFGTVDNPHVIFTNDIPFRFVGCTGQPSEDDHDAHEIMFFLLREGPLQRCMTCGQVFKLVRLRQEFSIINDYYTNAILKSEFEEIGDADHFVNFNPLRIMPFTWEHSLFEVRTNTAFTLRNADDHDRMLVDPAYRMEVMTLAEHKAMVAEQAYRDVNQAYVDTYGLTKVALNKAVYENVVKADIAMAEYDKHLRRMTKFYTRELVEPENHARREKRMLERSKARVEDSHTIYLGEFTEEELQYRDYFETDLEVSQQLERDPTASKAKALQNPEMALRRFIFAEEYTNNPEGDMSSLVQRKVFRFKYRQALSDEQSHARRERRMIERAQARGFPELEALARSLDMKAIADISTVSASKANNELLAKLARGALQNYRDYFESDLEEDIELIEGLPDEEVIEFSLAYENPLLEKMLAKFPKTHLSFRRSKDEYASGLLVGDSSEFFEKLEAEVGSKIAELQGLAFDSKRLDSGAEKPQLKQASNDKKHGQ